MPRFAYAVISVLAHVAAQETRITDPVAAAIGEKKLYELMKAEYTDERCEAAGWGPFPNATSTSLTAEAYSKAHGQSGCKCGMLYGLAHSSLSHEDDVAAMSTSAQGPARCSPCMVRVSVLSLGPRRREQHRGGAVPRQARRVLPSLARRPRMSKRLLYVPLVPFPRRDRRLNGSRLAPLPLSVLCLMFRKY